MKGDRMFAIVVLLIISAMVIFVVWAIGTSSKRREECEQQGGVMVRTGDNRVCIKAEVIDLD